jgi:hypothetical protein
VTWKILAMLAQTVSGLLLLCFSIPLVLAFLGEVFRTGEIENRLFVEIFVLLILWALWATLPDVCRWKMYRSLIRKSGSFKGPEGS